MAEYKVEFDFTTFRNSSITGRKGQINLITDESIESCWENEDAIKKLCAHEVNRLKPSYQIFSLDIKKISLFKPKTKTRKQ